MHVTVIHPMIAEAIVCGLERIVTDEVPLSHDTYDDYDEGFHFSPHEATQF